MEREPLLPYVKTRRTYPPPPPSPAPAPPPPLLPLREDEEFSLPHVPLTPLQLKDRLIFGPAAATPRNPQSNSSSFVDALNLTLNSPKSSIADPTPRPPIPPPQQSFLNPNRRKKGLHRAKTAPAMAAINDFNRTNLPVRPPEFGSNSILRQAIVLLILYLALGVVIYSFNRDNFNGSETHPVVDALYFCIVTMCTIGYGDITPNSTVTKLFSIMFVLVGFGFIDILLAGMVGYVLDLQEKYLLSTVKGGGEDHPRSYIIDVKKGRMRIRIKVALALGVVVLCIGIGACVMHFVEKLGWLDSFYLSVMSVTTVGYGDRAFSSLTGRFFAAIWLLVSTLAVARAFLYLTEARVDKRHRRMAKWVLGQDMTVAQFLAADIDNNGSVRYTNVKLGFVKLFNKNITFKRNT
ncbi:hypothetical protein LguiA_014856 [Lonicera macranthoides]